MEGTIQLRYDDNKAGDPSTRVKSFRFAVPNRPSEVETHSQSNQALAEGTREDLNKYLPLYKAALRGDWEAASDIFDRNNDALTARITAFSQTALHIACTEVNIEFVKNMLQKMEAKDLEMVDNYGNTALVYAAMAGCIETVKALVSKNGKLTQIKNRVGETPVLYAAMYEEKDVLLFLCSETRDEDPSPFSGATGARLLNNIIAFGYYDVALSLLDRCPDLATSEDEFKNTPLYMLAVNPSKFASGTRLGFFERLIYKSLENSSEGCGDVTKIDHISWGMHESRHGNSSTLVNLKASNVVLHAKELLWYIAILVPTVKKVYEVKLMNTQAMKLLRFIYGKMLAMESEQVREYFEKANILSTATENGIVEIIIECFRYFPDLMWTRSKNGRSVFHMAVEHRREKIFNLIYGFRAYKKVWVSSRDNSHNNILHLAAMLAPYSQLNSVSGAALQMQRELQWYKEVEKIVKPYFKEWVNKKNQTPPALFKEEHKQLVAMGEEWMKGTSSSCMVVATLIATVVFAAAFTVPGGNDNENGTPIYLNHTSFRVFIAAAALGLFSSTTSLLMFLAILTSRYAEEDFLKSLPMKLIIGLATLFMSIAAMVTAFTASLFIVLNQTNAWLVIPIFFVACIPVTSFGFLQFPLFLQIFRSTFGSGIFDRRTENVIYKRAN